MEMANIMGKTRTLMKMKTIARGGYIVSSKCYSQSEFGGMKKVVVGSNTQWRGKSYAASVPSSDIPKDAQRGRKRFSKDERYAMVESFVNKYREMNAGKFPTASVAKKEVGGCYYTVRKIIQELEYSSKTPPLDSRRGSTLIEPKVGGSVLPPRAENVISEEVVKPTTPGSHSDLAATRSHMVKEAENISYPCIEISKNVNAEEVSHSYFKKLEDEKKQALHNEFEILPAESHLPKKETEGVSHPFVEISEDVKTEGAQHGHSGFAVTNSCQLGEETKAFPPCIENVEDDRKEQAVFKDRPNFESLEIKVEQRQGSVEPEKVPEDTSSRKTTDAEVPKKPSLWENVKAFADGIIRGWRKM